MNVVIQNVGGIWFVVSMRGGSSPVVVAVKGSREQAIDWIASC